LHTARNLYKPDDIELTPTEYIELTNRFLNGYQKAAQKEGGAGKIADLRREIEEYQFKLDLLGLSDSKVSTYKRTNADLFQILANALFWFPIAMIGTLLNSPIAILSKFGGTLLARGEIVEEATYKLLVAIFVGILTYTVLPILVAWQTGSLIYGLDSFIIFATTGIAAVKVQPFTTIWRFTSSAFKIVPKEFREERACLKKKVLEAVDEFVDPDIPRMFYANQ